MKVGEQFDLLSHIGRTSKEIDGRDTVRKIAIEFSREFMINAQNLPTDWAAIFHCVTSTCHFANRTMIHVTRIQGDLAIWQFFCSPSKI